MKKTVMTVDNEPDTLDLIKTMLEGNGFDTIAAHGGSECLKLLEKSKKLPNLVLLDVMMPDMSGWDVFTIIKKRYPKLNVAFLSVLEVSDGRRKQLMKEGLRDYILKPFTEQKLVAKVRALTR